MCEAEPLYVEAVTASVVNVVRSHGLPARRLGFGSKTDKLTTRRLRTNIETRDTHHFIPIWKKALVFMARFPLFIVAYFRFSLFMNRSYFISLVTTKHKIIRIIQPILRP